MRFETWPGPTKVHRSRKQPRRGALLLAAAAAAATAAARQSFATNKTYNGPSGNWSTITWVPAGQPINGDAVNIGNGTNGTVIVTYDAGAIANSLFQLTLDATNAGSVTLAQAQGSLTTTGSENVGFSGAGALNISGGTHTVGNGLFFGFNGGASGSGTLSGNGVLNVTGVNNEEYVGVNGNGKFLQSGGSNTTYFLTMGYNASGDGAGTNVGSGVYTQTGGTLSVTSGEYVGWYGNGVVNQSGGFNTAANLYIGVNLNSGTNPAASGVYSMSNGASLVVNNSFFVGASGSGTFNQTGGNATATSGIILAAAAGGTGVVNLSGGTLTGPTLTINNASAFHQSSGTVNLSSAGNALPIGNSAATATYTLDGASSTLLVTGTESVGNNGNGSFTQNGGANTVNTLYVGNANGASGTYTLAGGVLTTAVESVGGSGSGNFIQNGGTNNLNLYLRLGDQAGARGTYVISAGSLLSNELTVGYFGQGTFTQSGGSATFFNLFAGSQPGSLGVYNLNAGGSLQVTHEQIGINGTGTFNQSGGTHTVQTADYSTIGADAAGLGTYNLSGGLFSCAQASLYLGAGPGATGVMNHSGGTAAVGDLFVGNAAASGTSPAAVGTYNLSNGATLTVLRETIGDLGGIGTFNQTGGSHSVAQTLRVGASASGTSAISGTFNQSGGTLNVASSETVGGDGYGLFTQSGGTNVTPLLFLSVSNGPTNPSAGTYVLSGGLLSVNFESVGNATLGVFNQTGGIHVISGTSGAELDVAVGVGSSGTFNLSGGSLSLTNGAAYVGYGGNGAFNQSGGTFQPYDLYVGFGATGTNPANSGVYNLSGSNAALNVLGTEYIGFLGNGTFNQSAGTHTAGSLKLGDVQAGTYNLNGGSLATTFEFVGYFGNGAFNQTAGLHSVTNDLNVAWGVLGTNPASTGTFSLSGGRLTVGSNENVGVNGSGMFNQSGGTNTVAGSLFLGYLFNGTNPASSGSYSLSGGNLNVGSFEFVGNGGNGVFNQSGGTNTGFYLTLGENSIAFGTYNLSNGATLVLKGAQIGVGGNGVFNQTGGTFTVGGSNGANELNLGATSGGAGTVNLSGGAILGAPGFVEKVGYFGLGVFNQSGASTNSLTYLYLGSQSASFGNPASGAYTLSGGTLNVASEEGVGYYGNGNFTQSGGSHAVGVYLFVGYADNGTNPASFGTFNLSGGSLSAGNWEQIGRFGDGVFNQTGGSNSTQIVYLGDSDNFRAASGTYNLSGASSILTISQFNYVGYAGPGVFNQSGGTHNLSNGWLVLGYAANVSGTYNLFGGNLIAGAEQIGQDGNGVFNQSGGSNSIAPTGAMYIANVPGGTGSYNLSGGYLTGTVFNYGSFTQTGGTYGGTFVNNLNFTYGGGTFNGGFIQQPGATFSFAAPTTSFTANGGMTNHGNLSIGPGQTIGAIPIMDIEGGSVMLSGGSISGGDLLNNGTISGYGSIVAAGFTNSAVITQGAGNLTLSASSNTLNNGQINLALGRQFQIGGTTSLANAGTFNVNGAQVTGTNALINLANGVLSGPGMIAAPLSNSGTLLVPVGTFNIVQPFNNTGLIQLAAPGASLIGGTITNTSTIQGIGSLGSPVSNLGTIEAPGPGTLNLTGAVTNAASGLLAALTGGKLLLTFGLPVNSGLINLVGGTFDNDGHPLSNSGDISGYGILRTGGLVNASGRTITFNGGFTTVNGDVTNSAGATIRAALNPVLFTGNLVNNGTIKVTGAPTNTVTIAGTYSGSGSYISDPADNYFLSDVSVSGGGVVSGAAGDRFLISGTYANAGTYNNNGGSLVGQNVINTGSFNQLAGQATILALSGTGAAAVGGGAGTALVSVSSLSQGSVTINSGGTLTIRPTGSRLTNSAVNLQINGTGTLDLANHELLTNTAPNTIKSYLANAYDPNGNADWGQHGLTSSVARNNPITYSLGYANGSDPSAQDAGVTTHNGTPLGASQTIIRPVLVGDANMDGSVDFFDITQILGYKYNTNQAASYTDGDLDYSGHVDFFDIVLLLSANYNSGQTYLGSHSATPTLTRSPHIASSTSAIASATTIGVTGDGKPDFEYDPATGHLRFRTDGGTFTTTGGSASFVSSLTISSTNGILLSGGASAAFANGVGATLTSTLMSSALTQSPGFGDGFDIGIVLAPGLDAATLTADLTVKYQTLNGGSLKTADVTFIPEPAGMVLLGVASGALAMRRRRRCGRCLPSDHASYRRAPRESDGVREPFVR